MIFGGCTTAPRIEDGVSHLPTHETLVIFGTNDLHGSLSPISFKSKEADGTASVTYERGGAAILAGHLAVLRREYGDRLLWLDGGDEFQGSIESNLEQGAPMVKFFNQAGLDAAVVGNHEFDFGVDALRARMAEARYPYLGANIVEKTTGALPVWANLLSSRIFYRGGLKVGVLGLSTLDTPTTTRAQNVAMLEFRNLYETTIRESAALRAQGAEIVVITAHVGLKCTTPPGAVGHRMRKPDDPQGSCLDNGEMVKLMRKLPPGTVDAIVSGHSHTVIHHYINGIPVIQAGARGHQYNLIFVTYDRASRKVIPELTRIEGPVPVCPKVFRNQQDCAGDVPPPSLTRGRGSLIRPSLHGEPIIADEGVTVMLAPIFAKSAAEKQRVLATAARGVEHIRTEESPMGDLIADALRESTQADAALVNAGGIRANFEPGPITYEDLFRVLPFDNFVSVLTVTGAELKTILRIAQNGSRGYFPTSGLKIRVVHPSIDPKATDLNGDGKLEPWEADRMLSAQFADGSKINDFKKYRLATLDFLVTGGDDMAWIMSKIPADRIQLTAGPVIRDVVEARLQKLKTINSVDAPLVNATAPRLLFIKAEPAMRRRGKRRRR